MTFSTLPQFKLFNTKELSEDVTRCDVTSLLQVSECMIHQYSA